jgi:hypothetical protein
MSSPRFTSLVTITVVALGACAPLLGIEDVTATSEPDASSSFDASASDASASDVRSDAVDDAREEKRIDPPAKRVFVTSDVWNGVMGGESGVDSRCVAAADRAGLGGTWSAWVSVGGKNAIDRIEHDGPYDRLDRMRVVRNKAQLVSGVLTNPINVTETGEPFSGETLVWTGTFANGAASQNCKDWTTREILDFGALGNLDRTNGTWTDNGGTGATRNWGCQTSARLYCFER